MKQRGKRKKNSSPIPIVDAILKPNTEDPHDPPVETSANNKIYLFIVGGKEQETLAKSYYDRHK